LDFIFKVQQSIFKVTYTECS